MAGPAVMMLLRVRFSPKRPSACRSCRGGLQQRLVRGKAGQNKVPYHQGPGTEGTLAPRVPRVPRDSPSGTHRDSDGRKRAAPRAKKG